MDCEENITENEAISLNTDCKQNSGMSDSQTELFLYRTNTNSLLDLHKTFKELAVLTIIGEAKLYSLSGIENLANLQELLVAECRIQVCLCSNF